MSQKCEHKTRAIKRIVAKRWVRLSWRLVTEKINFMEKRKWPSYGIGFVCVDCKKVLSR